MLLSVVRLREKNLSQSLDFGELRGTPYELFLKMVKDLSKRKLPVQQLTILGMSVSNLSFYVYSDLEI